VARRAVSDPDRIEKPLIRRPRLFQSQGQLTIRAEVAVDECRNPTHGHRRNTGNLSAKPGCESAWGPDADRQAKSLASLIWAGSFHRADSHSLRSTPPSKLPSRESFPEALGTASAQLGSELRKSQGRRLSSSPSSAPTSHRSGEHIGVTRDLKPRGAVALSVGAIRNGSFSHEHHSSSRSKTL
jgi:hypothetical protein